PCHRAPQIPVRQSWLRAYTVEISNMPPTELTATNAQPSSAPLTQLSVSGMTCGNCARHVTEALQGVTGVQSAAVSLDSHQASVRWRVGTAPDVQALLEAVKE